MPTAQSIAIREETAIERIRQATVTLKARTGAEFNDVDLNVRMASTERQAVTLEQIADILESLAVVLQDPVELDDDDSRHSDLSGMENEDDDGSTEQGKRKPSPRRKT